MATVSDTSGCEVVARPHERFCRAPGLWVQASLDCKQRLRQLFFPEGVASDGTRFNRTEPTAPLTLIRQLYASASFEFATLPGRYLARGFPPDAFPSARAALQQLDRLMTGATPVDLRDRETKMLRLVVE